MEAAYIGGTFNIFSVKYSNDEVDLLGHGRGAPPERWWVITHAVESGAGWGGRAGGTCRTTKRSRLWQFFVAATRQQRHAIGLVEIVLSTYATTKELCRPSVFRLSPSLGMGAANKPNQPTRN